ncbi:MAG: ParB/RepB/Spo0J family partition protein [Xanthomonadales bacterium]|nr:ParB/RepB/Spo0J family partition protein [Xanthomonadales bacterium]
MAERRRLGRGLDALIPSLDSPGEADGEVRRIPLHRVELNPRQPRLEIDADKLDQLADSIRSSGVIQPILVRPAESGYELVVGERRVRAARRAGLETVPAIVRDVPDEKMLELALVENIQRADLNPIEKARAIRQMIAELDLTQEEAGRRLGLDRSTVANALRLLDLSDEVQAMVAGGKLSAGHGRALLAVEEPSRRAELAAVVASKGLSVRETERLASRGGRLHRAEVIRRPSPNVVQLEESLSEALEARVEVKSKRQGGKIVVHFRDHEDFERLYESLTGRSTLDYPQKVPA